MFTAGPVSASKDHPAKDLVEHVGKVLKKGLGGWEWDGVGLAIGVGGDGHEEEWDEICAEAGLEFVSVGGKGDTGRNEFGGMLRGLLLQGVSTDSRCRKDRSCACKRSTRSKRLVTT